MRWAVVACALAGCGRLAFDAHGDAGAAQGDVSRDTLVASDAFDQAAACAGFLFCDSFEDAALGAQWMADPGVAIDTTTAHRGNHSVRLPHDVIAVNTGGYTRITEIATPTQTPAGFFVRVWMKLSALPAANNRMELIAAEQSGGGQGDYLMALSTNARLYSQFDGQITGTAGPPPVNSWFCAVFEVQRATGPTGLLSLIGDLGTVNLTNTTTDNSTTPLAAVRFGIGFASANVTTAQPPMIVWLDDVIVDRVPPTCAD